MNKKKLKDPPLKPINWFSGFSPMSSNYSGPQLTESDKTKTKNHTTEAEKEKEAREALEQDTQRKIRAQQKEIKAANENPIQYASNNPQTTLMQDIAYNNEQSPQTWYRPGYMYQGPYFSPEVQQQAKKDMLNYGFLTMGAINPTMIPYLALEPVLDLADADQNTKDVANYMAFVMPAGVTNLWNKTRNVVSNKSKEAAGKLANKLEQFSNQTTNAAEEVAEQTLSHPVVNPTSVTPPSDLYYLTGNATSADKYATLLDKNLRMPYIYTTKGKNESDVLKKINRSRGLRLRGAFDSDVFVPKSLVAPYKYQFKNIKDGVNKIIKFKPVKRQSNKFLESLPGVENPNPKDYYRVSFNQLLQSESPAFKQQELRDIIFDQVVMTKNGSNNVAQMGLYYNPRTVKFGNHFWPIGYGNLDKMPLARRIGMNTLLSDVNLFGSIPITTRMGINKYQQLIGQPRDYLNSANATDEDQVAFEFADKMTPESRSNLQKAVNAYIKYDDQTALKQIDSAYKDVPGYNEYRAYLIKRNSYAKGGPLRDKYYNTILTSDGGALYGPGGPIKRQNLLAGMKSPEEVAAGESDTAAQQVPVTQTKSTISSMMSEAEQRKLVQGLADIDAQRHGYADAADMAEKEAYAQAVANIESDRGEIRPYEGNVTDKDRTPNSGMFAASTPQENRQAAWNLATTAALFTPGVSQLAAPYYAAKGLANYWKAGYNYGDGYIKKPFPGVFDYVRTPEGKWSLVDMAGAPGVSKTLKRLEVVDNTASTPLKRAIEVGMRTGESSRISDKVFDLNYFMRTQPLERKMAVARYILTGTNKIPGGKGFYKKGYYNSLAGDNPFLKERMDYTGFYGPTTSQGNDLIDAFLYGKEIDPEFGVKLVDKGKGFGIHEKYVAKNYPEKAKDIQVYEVNPANLPFESLGHEGNVGKIGKGEQTGYVNDYIHGLAADAFPSVLRHNSNTFVPNVAGHKIVYGTEPGAFYGQDIWKFAPKEYAKKWNSKSLIEKAVLNMIDKNGTPVIMRTPWMKDVKMPGTYANGGPVRDRNYNTILTPEQEREYAKWVETLPMNLRSDYDYDLRGAWLAGDLPDGNNHMTDRWKKPWHPTFSNESVYSAPGAEGGRWDGEEFHPSQYNNIMRAMGKYVNWGINSFARGGKTPDWDPENPYHIHTEDGKKISFTPEAYAALTSDLKEQVDKHAEEMNTFENQYMVNPEWEDFQRRLQASRTAENVAASRGEYWDRNWYDPNYKSGAYSFDDNGLLTYQGQTYAPFGDRSWQAIMVPMRTPKGISYGANEAYYPVTVPQQYIPRVPERVDAFVDEETVNDAVSKAQQRYIAENSKTMYGVNPYWITHGWETSFGYGDPWKPSPKQTYIDYYGNISADNPIIRSKYGVDIVKRMMDSGKPMYYYMRGKKSNIHTVYAIPNEYIPDIYVDYDTAKKLRDAYTKSVLSRDTFNEYYNDLKNGKYDFLTPEERDWQVKSIDDERNRLLSNSLDIQRIIPIRTKPTEEEARKNAQITIGDIDYLGSSYSKGGHIHIKKENRGKFTAAAERVGKSVQEYARQILANKEDYSPTLVKRANFAHVFGKK